MLSRTLFPSLSKIQLGRAQVILDHLKVEHATPHLCQRVEGYYLPLYTYFAHILESRNAQGPLLIGVSAPQGCGKTTLTSCIEHLFKSEDKACVVMSIDDFYFTGSEQEALAAQSHYAP